MRVPKTFIPEKSLETKIKRLLEKQKPRARKRNHVYRELKKEFPQFTDYLLKIYPEIWILKKINDASYSWYFYTSRTQHQQATEIGSATVYIKKAGEALLEYGNEAQISITQGRWYNLKYRQGYYLMDNKKEEIIEDIKDPYRYDKIKEIPFP